MKYIGEEDKIETFPFKMLSSQLEIRRGNIDSAALRRYGYNLIQGHAGLVRERLREVRPLPVDPGHHPQGGHTRLGQRVEAFALDRWSDGRWQEFAQGPAIGSRRRRPAGSEESTGAVSGAALSGWSGCAGALARPLSAAADEPSAGEEGRIVPGGSSDGGAGAVAEG